MIPCKIIQLNLNTGELVEYNSEYTVDIKSYFEAINNLNKSAHTYGVVYLASAKALASLPRMSKNDK